MTIQHSGRSKSRLVARALWILTLGSLSAPVSHGQTWDPIVDVGPGIPDTNTRQVVRTSSNVVSHAFYGASDTTSRPLLYRNRIGGTWSAPTTISTMTDVHRVSCVFDSSSTLHVSYWSNNPPTITYRERTPAGSW